MPLINLEHSRREVIPEDQLPNAILSGTHAFEKGDLIPVINPQGEYVKIPAEQLKEALSQNYAIQTTSQQAVHNYAKENDNLSGEIKTFLGSAGDELLMHLPEIIGDRVQSPLEVAKRKAMQEQNKISDIAGRVGGFLGSLTYGGPIAEAAGRGAEEIVARKLGVMGMEGGAKKILAKGLADRIALGATKLGVESAVFSAPRVSAETLLDLQDPELSAENVLAHGFKDLAMNTVLGAVLGAAGPIAMDTLKLGGKAIKPILNKASEVLSPEGAAFNIFGVPAGKSARLEILKPGLRKELPSFISEEMQRGLFDTTTDTVEGLKDIKNKALDVIIGPVGEDGIRTGGLMDKSTVAFGDIAPKLEKVTSDLEDVVERYKSVPGGDRAVAPLEDFIRQLKEVPSAQEGIGNLYEKMKTIDDLINYNRAYSESPELVKGMRKVRAVYRDVIDDAVERYKGKDTLDALKKANRNFEIAATMLPYAEKKGSQEIQKSFLDARDVIYGTLGHFVGGNVGGAIGAFLSPLMKPYRDNAILLANEKLLAKTAGKLDGIPDRVKNMLSRAVPINKETTSVGALSRLLDNNDSKDKQIRQLNDKLAQYKANPAMAIENMSKMTQGLPPNLAQHLTTKMATTLDYLHQTSPKPMELGNDVYTKPWHPSDSDISKLERRLDIVQNPFKIIDRLENGTISTEDIQTIQTTNPKLFAEMQKRVMKAMIHNDKPVSYSMRLKISKFMGQPYDNSLKPQNIWKMQQKFLQPKPLQGGIKSGTLKMPNLQTDIGRITEK